MIVRVATKVEYPKVFELWGTSVHFRTIKDNDCIIELHCKFGNAMIITQGGRHELLENLALQGIP